MPFEGNFTDREKNLHGNAFGVEAVEAVAFNKEIFAWIDFPGIAFSAFFCGFVIMNW